MEEQTLLNSWSSVKVGVLTIMGNDYMLHKGILGDVLVDGVKHSSWKAYSLEFKYSFTTRCVCCLCYVLLW